ncbi:sugar ABC transporter ATP-binding protein [Oryzobacter terrae]|uniref:sugar ABC transporter ATP-binding protein n=1 Tax=Oryzobacter terrae TaxID=1620385 RepID=UPI003671CC53
MSATSAQAPSDERGQVLLAVEGLSKSYGRARAMSDVSVSFAAGEVHALLGENGAGKSTLVKAIAGVITPDSGRIHGPAHESGDVAMVFQELSVIPEMSIMDNLALSSRGRRGPVVSYAKLRERAQGSLAAAGLSNMALDQPVEVLSLAQRQLLEIARGLMANAKVLILDEPTATLSDVEIARVHSVIRSLTDTGTAIVYITHRLGEVFELADRISVMRAGRVVATGPTGDFSMKTLVTAMLGADHQPVQKDIPESGPEARSVLAVEHASATGAYDDVSLEVRGGEVVALFGQIGSGADDLVRSVAGLLPLDGGQVLLDGAVLAVGDRARAQRAGISYISPDRVNEGVFLEAAVTTNISSGALHRTTSRGVINRRLETALAKELAALVALDPSRVREPVLAFSGGNQQKVAIARALASQPVVLVLNEPTRGVDIGARSEIYRSIRQRAAKGVLVLLYSSDIVEIRELADRVITMYRGRHVGTHKVDAVADSQLLTEILNGSHTHE